MLGQEMTLSEIRAMVSPFPGEFVVYRLVGREMKVLYFTDSILSSFDVSADDFRQATENNALDVVMPGDREHVLATVLGKPVGPEEIHCVFRLMHRKKGFFWVHSKSRIIGTNEGGLIVLTNYLNASAEAESYSRALDDTDTAFYTVDLHTHEILYANRAAMSRAKIATGTIYAWHPCYEYFFLRDAPCPTCPMEHLKPDEFLRDERFDPDTGRWRAVMCRRVVWCNHDCLEVFTDDITEKKNREAAKREKFRLSIQTMLAANPDALCSFQLNLTRNVCSEGHGASAYVLRALRAGTADGLFANGAANIPDEAEREKFLAVFNREKLLAAFREGRSTTQADYLRRDENDRPVWVRAFLSMLRNPETGDVEAAIYSVDVSREKQRDAIFRIITSQEYDLIALLHLDAGTVEAFFLGRTLPRAFREFLPQPGAVCGLDRFRANAMENWVVPDDRKKYRQCSDPAYYRPLMDRYGRFEFVLRQRFPDVPGGEIFRKFQHYYLGGRDTILVIESDVTEACRRQQRELDLAKAETERFTDIMDSISSGISVLRMADPDHMAVEYVNRQIFRILNYPSLENLPQRLADAPDEASRTFFLDGFSSIHPDDRARVRKTFRENYNAAFFTVDPYRMPCPNGEYKWVAEDVKFRETARDGRVFYATFRDVTGEIRLQDELARQLRTEQALRRQATYANEAKSDFLSRMSHDIRTPLNGIIGMTYLARGQSNPPATADCLDKIDTSSKFLLGLINDILDMSKAESGKIELHPEPYLMADFDRYIDSVIRPLCEGKSQLFTVETHPVGTVIPIMDILRFNQIMFNLLSNAVKYTPEGGKISLCVKNALVPGHRERITATVSDNGIGMSEAFQEHLFEPFTQEGRSDTSESRGSGLGLTIVKRMVELMGGTIRVKSRLGEGTSFTVVVDFDYLEADQATWNRDEGRNAVDVGLLAGKHVLLCEDHPLNQELARALLSQKGMSAEIAENGQRGVELFRRSAAGFYDVILMDIRMPVMDGCEAARTIRALPRADAASVPILAMTADAFDDDVRRCLDAGMDGHIAKPIDPEAMYRAIAEVMSRPPRRAPLP